MIDSWVKDFHNSLKTDRAFIFSEDNGAKKCRVIQNNFKYYIIILNVLISGSFHLKTLIILITFFF